MIPFQISNHINHQYSFENFRNSGWITEEGIGHRLIDKRSHSIRKGYFNRIQSLNSDYIEYTGYHQDWNRVVNMDINNYFNRVAQDHPLVSLNDAVIGGMPAISGSRIPISLIISCLKDGMSLEEICEDYGLKKKSVVAALEFVVDLLNRPFHEE